jgi:hypothetical protein
MQSNWRVPIRGASQPSLISMNHALFKALIALLPVSLLLSGSAILWLRGRTAFLFMQLCGAGCIAVVVLTHICEALHLFPGMNWGMEHSAGHYVDLVAAVVGFTLFPAGYLLGALFQK